MAIQNREEKVPDSDKMTQDMENLNAMRDQKKLLEFAKGHLHTLKLFHALCITYAIYLESDMCCSHGHVASFYAKKDYYALMPFHSGLIHALYNMHCITLT